MEKCEKHVMQFICILQEVWLQNSGERVRGEVIWAGRSVKSGGKRRLRKIRKRRWSAWRRR